MEDIKSDVLVVMLYRHPPNKSQDSHSIFLLEVKSSQVYKNKLGLIDKHSVGSDVERGGGLYVCVSFRHSVTF